ncbi:polypeptide N-acetylgalactosaminyltransferase 11-like isoform X2 [Daphnia pulex]|uniref:polypeptide N-acetylgalactosaminyltransferase 11-like isoform X2 n=1 Tax=Daphnia pulex TaxID=6669 RepID=UPI001EDDF5F9|nr:polypeptide N-acetylgalactosaminyltransferase 11-like isoform X2 [Daphnia pulex]XP_046446157.1 polypeptide N-acetylgalactosaminyltransferase 11-like isoform X2 [Daphnia pulex]
MSLIKTHKKKMNSEDQKIREDGYSKHAFNVLVSSRLDYHREIPDSRHKMCQTQKYPKLFLNTSVIICFYNEDPNTLFRTVHSVLDQTPAELLHEVLLVDDSSDGGNIHNEVEEFVGKNFPPKVQLLKTMKREGLIRARIFGAKKATGQVLIFLDSHCEVNREWVQPLIARIQENRTFVVTPIIDIINSDTFQYTSSPLVRGGFNWGLHFKWDSLPDDTLKTNEDFVKPILSPTMAGGLFAIEREYFFDIGEYDAGMNVWGGENLEISFRIWMCGGRLEIIPCSRVGHVFRRRRPYGSPNGEDTITYNSLRAAHVWLDDYIEHFFHVRPDARHVSYGDVGPRQRLRRLMKCQSFDWYLKNVYPELTVPGKESNQTAKKETISKLQSRRKYHKKNYVATYQIKLSGSHLCVESDKEVTSKGSTLLLSVCSRTKKQLWSVTDKGEMVLAQMLCMESPESSKQKPRLSKCHEMGGLQEWKHHDDIDTPVYNIAAGLCLGISSSGIKDFANPNLDNTPVIMTVCTDTSAAKWDFVKIP